MANTTSSTSAATDNVAPNLNVSRAPVSEPNDYQLPTPEARREAVTFQAVLAASVLIVIIGTTLSGAAYMVQHPGFDVQDALRAKLPGLAREKPDSQISRDVQSTLEGKYAAMGAAYARKEFPDDLYAPDYVEVSPQGATNDLAKVRAQLGTYFAHSLGLKIDTKVVQVTLTDAATALVTVTQNQTNTAPLAFYAEGAPRPSDATEHVVEAMSSRSVDTWKLTGEGVWRLTKETTLAQSPRRRRLEADSDAWNSAATEGQQPEETPEKNQIEAMYHGLDELRMRGQFPADGYVLEWKATDTQGGVHTLGETKQALTNLTSACTTAEFSTQLDDFMLTSPTHAYAKVTRRFTLKGAGAAKSDETATRREADTWRLEGNAWHIESTQQLSNSALWNYRENASSAPIRASASSAPSPSPSQNTASPQLPDAATSDGEFTDREAWSVNASSTRQPTHDSVDSHLIDYAPHNAIDGRVDTAWSKGGSNHEDGIGEWLQVTFPERTIARIGIVTGYPKTHPKFGDIFGLNNRLKKAQLNFSDGSSVSCSFRDEKEMQIITLPRPVRTASVRIVVDEVYPSSNIRAGKVEKERWHDTLIAEVAFWGHQEP